ncbi:hypothetical protein C0J52_06701 [Blattella germanica]|nr:hypothetical protein C0J52_06701 [Blattella germanica]
MEKGHQVLPTWIFSPQSQSVLTTGVVLLCSWLTISWIIQAIVALLWPCTVVLLIFVLFLPETADRICKELLTTDKIRGWIECFIQTTNNVAASFRSCS